MNKTNLFIDAGILAAFLVAMEPGLTGIPIHEWFSIAFAGTIIVHLLLHWKWIIQVGWGFFGKLFHSSRLKFVVDALLFVSFVAVMMSGLMISRSVLPALPVLVGRDFIWTRLHAASASAMLLFVGLHFALSWDWITGMVKRYLFSPFRAISPRQREAQHAPARVKAD